MIFRILHADCGAEQSVFNFSINDAPIGSVASSAACECSSEPMEVTFADAATLALIDPGLCNVYRMTVTDGGATLIVGQVHVTVEMENGQLEACLFDRNSSNAHPTCDSRALCDGPAFSEEVGVVEGSICPVCGAVASETALGQRDLDGDRIGDTCDDADAILNIRFARVRHERSRFRPSGSIVLGGDLRLAGASEAFDATKGLALRVADGLTLDESFAFAAEDCQLANGIVTCRSHGGHWSGTLRPDGAPTTRFRFAFKFDHLALSGPFQPDLTVWLTDDPPVPVEGIDRIGVVANCILTRNEMRCARSRQSGRFGRLPEAEPSARDQ